MGVTFYPAWIPRELDPFISEAYFNYDDPRSTIRSIRVLHPVRTTQRSASLTKVVGMYHSPVLVASAVAGVPGAPASVGESPYRPKPTIPHPVPDARWFGWEQTGKATTLRPEYGERSRSDWKNYTVRLDGTTGAWSWTTCVRTRCRGARWHGASPPPAVTSFGRTAAFLRKLSSNLGVKSAIFPIDRRYCHSVSMARPILNGTGPTCASWPSPRSALSVRLMRCARRRWSSLIEANPGLRRLQSSLGVGSRSRDRRVPGWDLARRQADGGVVGRRRPSAPGHRAS